VTSSRPLLFLVAVLAALAALTQARAAPLDNETCTKLKLEQGDLENAGVEQSMAKGPEWAKANLTPEKIQQVRRFIELEELIVFRCRGKTLVTLPPESEDSQDKDQSKKDKSAKQATDDDDDDGKETADKPADRPAGKQETVISKTMPPSQAAPPATPQAAGSTKAPAVTTKADPKQKPQAAKKPADKKATEPGAKAPAHPSTQAKSDAKKPDAGASKPPAKAAAQQPPKAAPKPPAKAKVDDAYKAPQSDSALNPPGAAEK
jgi:hypothetical protein